MSGSLLVKIAGRTVTCLTGVVSKEMPDSGRKQAAQAFLRLVTDGKIREAYQNVAPGFRHHNPYCKGDAASLMRGMEENEVHFPKKVFEIQRTIQEGDLVVVHSRIVLRPRELELAVVHIFRFEKDQIAELWDVAQQIPVDSPNENGMF